jgi:hypothetical protein
MILFQWRVERNGAYAPQWSYTPVLESGRDVLPRQRTRISSLEHIPKSVKRFSDKMRA